MSGPGSQQFGEPERFSFALPDVGRVRVPFNFINSAGLSYEAEEANRCVRAGLLESPRFSSAECLSVMQIISDIDAQSRPRDAERARALGVALVAAIVGGAAALFASRSRR